MRRETVTCNCHGRMPDDFDPDCCPIHAPGRSGAGVKLQRERRALVDMRKAPYPSFHCHESTYFATPEEHDRRLADGAIRCMTQLLERTGGREPSIGFRHILSALLEGMDDLRKELNVESE